VNGPDRSWDSQKALVIEDWRLPRDAAGFALVPVGGWMSDRAVIVNLQSVFYHEGTYEVKKIRKVLSQKGLARAGWIGSTNPAGGSPVALRSQENVVRENSFRRLEGRVADKTSRFLSQHMVANSR